MNDESEFDSGLICLEEDDDDDDDDDAVKDTSKGVGTEATTAEKQKKPATQTERKAFDDRQGDDNSDDAKRLSSAGSVAGTRISMTGEPSSTILRQHGIGSRQPPSPSADIPTAAAAIEINEADLEAEYRKRVQEEAVTAEPIHHDKNDLSVKQFAPSGTSSLPLLGIVAMVLLLLVGVVVGVLLNPADDDDADDDDRSVRNTDPPTGVPPIQADSLSPTQAPTAKFDVYYNTFYPVSGNALNDPASAQRQAFDWLLYDDVYPGNTTVTADPQKALLERYVMAVHYFSTNGPYWTDQLRFLTNTSICEWPNLYENEINAYTLNEVDCADGLVVKIRLHDINMTGTIAPELGALEHLEIIDFGNANLYGTIPTELNRLSNLEFFQVRGSLNGTFPLWSLPKLNLVSAANNQLTGTLPEFLPVMRIVDVSNNKLHGTIPDLPVDSQMFISFYERNMLEGTLPATYFTRSNSLWLLQLYQNRLNGTLPAEIRLANATLEEMQLQDNEFTGVIPPELGMVSNLVLLRLQDNSLNGTIPTEIGQLQKLREMDLSDNDFMGTLPAQMARMRALQHLNVASNRLRGTIPPGMELLLNLQSMDVSDNDFTSGIEGTFCSTNETSTTAISADCDEVSCPCCTTCCIDSDDRDSGSVCEISIYGVCLTTAQIFEGADDRGAVCQCTDDGTELTCDDTTCESCNADGSTCVVNTNYGYVLNNETGAPEIFSNTIKYVRGPYNDTITFRSGGDNGRCEVDLNGEQCSSCIGIQCASGFHGYVIFCDNVEGGNNFNSCEEFLEKGPLNAFDFIDGSQWSGCPLALVEVD